MKADLLYVKNHQCERLKVLPYKWPLALDLLFEVYRHAMKGQILHLLSNLVMPLPPTFEQKLLGLSGIDTMDPKNIEALLGTQFEGDRSILLQCLMNGEANSSTS